MYINNRKTEQHCHYFIPTDLYVVIYHLTNLESQNKNLVSCPPTHHGFVFYINNSFAYILRQTILLKTSFIYEYYTNEVIDIRFTVSLNHHICDDGTHKKLNASTNFYYIFCTLLAWYVIIFYIVKAKTTTTVSIYPGDNIFILFIYVYGFNWDRFFFVISHWRNELRIIHVSIVKEDRGYDSNIIITILDNLCGYMTHDLD